MWCRAVSNVFCKGLVIGMMMVFACQQNPVAGQEYFSSLFKPSYQIDGRKITSLTERSDGFLLLGTVGGVWLFDGMDYFGLPFPDSLSGVAVKVLLPVEKKLFAGLDNGMVLEWTDDGFQSAARFLGQTGAPVNALELGKDKLWIATYGNGLHYLNLDDSSPKVLEDDAVSERYLYDLQVDDSENLWVASDAGLLKRSQSATGISVDPTPDLPDLLVTALCADEDDRMWIGFQDAGFCSFDTRTGKVIPIPASHDWDKGRVNQMLRLDDYLWILANKGVVMVFEPRSGQLFEWPPATEASPPEKVHCLEKSNLHGFWLAGSDGFTWTAGMQIATLKSSAAHPTEAPTALLCDSQQRLWWSNQHGLFAGTTVNGSISSVQKIHVNPPQMLHQATCLFEDQHGNIWVGTLENGLFRIIPESGLVRQFTTKEGLLNNNILSIEAEGDTLRIGTFGGLATAVLNAAGNLHFPGSLQKLTAEAYLYDLLTFDGGLWMATDGNGMMLLKDQVLMHPLPDSLQKEAFYCMAVSADSAVWMSLPGKGLLRWKNGMLSQLGTEEGLSSSTITSLIQTRSPYLFAVGYDGFDLIHTSNLKVIQVSKLYNLPSTQSGLNVVTADQSGTVYIGTNQGIIRLEDPEVMARRQPVLRWRSLSSNMVGLQLDSVFTLRPQQRQLSAAFAGLWYPQPGHIRYNVSLEGADSSRFSTRDQMVHFGSLRPGNYTLSIQTENVMGIDSIQLAFGLQRPLWQRWWFVLISAMVAALVLRLWIRQREAAIREKQQMLREKAVFEYHYLRDQVNPHFLFNSFSTLIALIEQEGTGAVPYVEKLSDFFRQILEHREAATIGLDEELKLLETYLFLQHKRYGNGLRTEINIPTQALDSRIPPMTLQMLAENALKHNVATKDKPLLIKMYVKDDMLVVENNRQPKIHPEASTGLGLRNINARYRLLTDRLPRVEEDVQHFSLWLPLIVSS